MSGLSLLLSALVIASVQSQEYSKCIFHNCTVQCDSPYPLTSLINAVLPDIAECGAIAWNSKQEVKVIFSEQDSRGEFKVCDFDSNTVAMFRCDEDQQYIEVLSTQLQGKHQ